MPNVYDIDALIEHRKKIGRHNLWKPDEIPKLKTHFYFSEGAGISIKHSEAKCVKGLCQFLCTNCKISPEAQEKIQSKAFSHAGSLKNYELTREELKELNIIDESGNYTPFDSSKTLSINNINELNLPEMITTSNISTKQQAQEIKPQKKQINNLITIATVGIVAGVLLL